MKNVHIWEKVEIVLQSSNQYSNPYTDVDLWVDLEGPDYQRRCFGFWDGEDVFKVRIMSTASGVWHWSSGCSSGDPGLTGKEGSFNVQDWSEEEKTENPNRRGMVCATPNGHAFEYADGTPYFMLGDTWWAMPTFRFPWYEGERQRDIGPDAGFKDYVLYRKRQGYNCIAMIASFPNWQQDDKPHQWIQDDGMVVRSAWQQAGTDSAKAMHNENGDTAFSFPGRISGLEKYVPDLQRINPDYFRMMDKKIDYLNAQGFIPFIEVARRDIGQLWKQHYPWPESYARYIQYVWARYQANICFYSPIHFDWAGHSIPASEWNRAAISVMEKYGLPPFGTMLGTNANPSSMINWGHLDQAPWLGFHQIGNQRTHHIYEHLTDIYLAQPPIPGINGEPYYDGMEDADPGSDKAARYCRSAIYGSVLSGGLGGQIYGAGGWGGGIWSGEVEQASRDPIWEAIQWESAAQMPYCRDFIMSEGVIYEELIPATNQLYPNRNGDPKTNDGWAFCAMSSDKDLILCYFEISCPQAALYGIQSDTEYALLWFNPRNGQWLDMQQSLKSGADDILTLPLFPGGESVCQTDWALKLTKKA